MVVSIGRMPVGPFAASLLQLLLSMLFFLLCLPHAGGQTSAMTPPQSQAQQSCVNQLNYCVQASGSAELQALGEWLETAPTSSLQLGAQTKDAGPSSLETGAFGLLRDLGLAVLGVMLDVVLYCRAAQTGQDPGCSAGMQHFQQVISLRHDVEARMRELMKNYAPDNGVRSPVIKAARNARTDIDRFGQSLSSGLDLNGALSLAYGLAETVGSRSRMLHHHLGMHAWIRMIAVPGRGVPMYVLHDEYTTWQEMLNTHVSNMAKHAPGGAGAAVALAEVGLSADSDPATLLRRFNGLQFVGILPPESPHTATVLQSRLAETSAEFVGRVAFYQSSSEASSAAIPPKAFDIIMVKADGRTMSDVLQDLQRWEVRVKPGGILAGTGFAPNSPGAVQAICEHRHFNEIHLGIGGTFWWYVEPEE